MKSTKTMVSILVASTLGLAGMATADSSDVAGGGVGDKTTKRVADADRRLMREQRRAARERTDVSANRQPRPDRSQSRQGVGARSEVSGNYDRGEGRALSNRRADWARYANRTEHRRSSRQDRARDVGASNQWGHKRLHRDQHNTTRTERRYDHAGRHTKAERRDWDKTRIRPSERYQRADRRWRGYGDASGYKASRRGFDNRVDRRVSNQRARISNGLENGKLTRREFKRLREDQKKIARMDRRFGSDGRYTKRERRKLSKALDRTSSRVHRAKNNDRNARAPGFRRRR